MPNVSPLKFALLLVSTTLLSAGCSNGKAPSGRWIDCGPPVAVENVTVLDIGPFGDDSAAVDRFVRDEVGAYRLFTPQPVGVPVREEEAAGDGSAGAWRARERAAQLGCDLLLLMHGETIRSGHSNPARSNQAGRNDRPVIVVMMGKREN